MKLPATEELRPLIWTAGILAILVIIGAMTTGTSAMGMFSLAFAIFAYLVLPGYCIMLNFAFSPLERIILGMIVSSAVVPAVLYTANLFGLAVSRMNVLFAIILIVALAVLYRKA